MQRTRAWRLISALAILMGEETEKTPSLPLRPRAQVPAVPTVSTGEVLQEVLASRRQEGARLGRIIPTETFSFNLGFQPSLEKPIASKMQEYGMEDGDDFVVSVSP